MLGAECTGIKNPSTAGLRDNVPGFPLNLLIMNQLVSDNVRHFFCCLPDIVRQNFSSTEHKGKLSQLSLRAHSVGVSLCLNFCRLSDVV